MSSPDLPTTRVEAREERDERGTRDDRSRTSWVPGGLLVLLDAAFGLFVWAAHFLVIYIAAAIACQLGLGAASEGARTTFEVVLVLVTVASAALVVLHALRRWRQQRDMPERRARMTITIGNDAIATVAIVWQLFVISLVPLCA